MGINTHRAGANFALLLPGVRKFPIFFSLKVLVQQ